MCLSQLKLVYDSDFWGCGVERIIVLSTKFYCVVKLL